MIVNFLNKTEVPKATRDEMIRVMEKALQVLKQTALVEINVGFVSADEIRAVNLEQRDKDAPTDVLSFPIYDRGEFDVGECISGALLGDIVISVPRAKEQAEELGNTFLREVAFLTVHSTLHLLGYDHERSDEDDETQCRIQKEIIETIF
jgi:probable rRNA maturation factor